MKTAASGGLLATALILGALPASAAPAAESVRTVTQTAQGATFDFVPGETRFDTLLVDGVVYAKVSVQGAVSSDVPGRPALPLATIRVGVPDGMSPRLRVVSSEWGDQAGPPPLPVAREIFYGEDAKAGLMSEYRTEPDPAIYGGSALYPPEEAALGKGVAVGEMWVVPVAIRPVRYDPRLHAYRVLHKMSLRVDFVEATEFEKSQRPQFRPGGDGAAWRRVQQGLVRNYEAARAFPIRARTLPARAPALHGARAANPEFRISVTTTGWVSVGYATASGAGFPLNVPLDQVAVFQRGYSDAGDSATSSAIPIVVKDVNTNNIFDAGDAVTFYAQNLRDRVSAGSIENRYTDANVYWLTWTGALAATPDSIPGDFANPSPRIPASFPYTIHLEQDRYIMPAPNKEVGAPPENVSYLFWTNGSDVPDLFDAPITFTDQDVSQPFRIQARYQGQYGSTHKLTSTYQPSSGPKDTLALEYTFTDQNVYVLDTGFTIPGTLMVAGVNHYQHVGERLFNSNWVAGSKAWLDWVDVTYKRLYTTSVNMLQFTSDGPGDVVELHVGGFTSTNIQVYDVTNPVAALRVTGVQVNPAGGGFEAIFRCDAVAKEHAFVAFVPGAEVPIAASAIVADTPSSLGVPGAFTSTSVARSIIIAPRAFLAPANRLADYRRAQGYVVEVAELQDVFDEYTGGVKSARAIRRYLRHAYLTWTPRPTFVVLAGDASMDYRHRLSDTSVDWVPTYIQFESIAGGQGFELTGHDSWYSINLSAVTPGDSDFTPSVFLARIPASSATELDNFVTKVIQYENFQDTDAWRGRMLLLSDDEYSSGILGNQGYCFQPIEAMFRQGNTDMAATAAASPSGQDIPSNFFDLKTYTDPLAVTCRNGIDPACRLTGCVVNAFRQTDGAVDAFQAALGQGALILNVQAHANRYLIAHEQIFCSGSPMVQCPILGFSDIDLIGNSNKPVYLMVFGCHSNQFPDGPFSTGSVDSTDSFGEQWLMLPNRGAIASFGSSGFEFINNTTPYNHYVADAFFTTPPVPPPLPGQPRTARWILGEVMGAAAFENAMSFYPYQPTMNLTMMLMGDPMLHMDALPPRIFETSIDGSVVTDGGPLASDSPTDSLTLIAKVRDEAGIRTTTLAERDLLTGAITPIDSTLYSVAVSDTGRQQVLTGRVRPHLGNYDLQVRATDGNGRLQIFALQVRTPIRYYADGVPIVNGVFVFTGALLRADVTTPIPVTADSLELWLDGVPIVATKSQTNPNGRAWRLESIGGTRGPGSHTLQVAVGGRTAGFDQATFAISSEFTMRGVVAVSPGMQGSGCAGSILQFELSEAATRVQLLLMTISGRRVASISIPSSAGLNVYCWDGRDSQGNTVATGLYLYRLTATSAAGRTLSQSGKMIRSR